MKRITFIKSSSLMAISVSAFGGIHWDGKNYVGNTPTTTDILGPFYRPGAPMRSNIIPIGSKGIPLKLSGTIFQNDGTTPMSNAFVEIWQCDENENYDNSSDGYLFRGAIKTGNDGVYDFKTIIPVPYKADPKDEASWRPAHIHMRVSSESQQDLVTQIYFKGDKYVDKDTWASSPQAVNRILTIEKSSSGENKVTFNVVMSKEFPLDKEVYSKITGLYKMDNGSIVEFTKNDDLLFMKRNGQLFSSLKYTGNNSFEAGIGFPKVNFVLLEKGGSKVVVVNQNTTYNGEKYLKYTE
ncbi:MAG: catechol 1,2-dioxygenase [Bacteroidota bacterium]